MNNEDNVQQGVDDGSLAFLRIPRDENSRSLIGDEIKQSKIVNTSFWVFKFLEDIPTRFSKQKGTAGQTLVQIRPSKDSPEWLRRMFFEHIKPFIENELELEIKGNWQIFPLAKNREDRHGRALDFVGYKFYREQKLIRKSIKQNFCRTVAKLNKRNDILLADYKQRVASWLGWAQHSNSKHLLKTIIKPEFQNGIL